MDRVRLICAGVLLSGFWTGLWATDIYRWVDDQGRTHLSDTVPDRFRESATRVDSRQYELTPEQQREAEERARRERERRSVPAEAKPPELTAPPVAGEPAQGVVKRPVQKVTDTTDCATWWRLFRESQECFGPFHVRGGGLRPEAYDHCNEVPSPPLRCGPRY